MKNPVAETTGRPLFECLFFGVIPASEARRESFRKDSGQVYPPQAAPLATRAGMIPNAFGMAETTGCNNYKMKTKIILSWTPTISYMAVIFYFSSLSKPINYELPYGADKIIHIIEYVVLGFLMAYSLKNSGVRRYVLVGWIAASVYGITDEMHQSYVAMRDASVFDVFADGLGSLAGAYCNKHFSLKEILR